MLGIAARYIVRALNLRTWLEAASSISVLSGVGTGSSVSWSPSPQLLVLLAGRLVEVVPVLPSCTAVLQVEVAAAAAAGLLLPSLAELLALSAAAAALLLLPLAALRVEVTAATAATGLVLPSLAGRALWLGC
jgi:hypothetical protein